MPRSGPVTKDTTTVALGLAQIRIADYSGEIANPHPALVAANSIGALANTKYTGNTDWFKLESGFPLLEDFTTPIREAAMLECAFKEITPLNMAIAHGKNPNEPQYQSTVHSGEVTLGGRVSPAFIRMEAQYTYPDGVNRMYIIFPKAQISASVEADLATEDAAAVPMVIEAKRADSEVTGTYPGNVVWDDKPLGRIVWTTA